MGLRQLVPFSAAALPVVEPWFDDADTRRWLGDRRWPAMVLRLAANPPTEARGDRSRTVDRRGWLFEEDAVAVALLDVEVYENQSAGCAFVVDPHQRGRGCGQRALRALGGHVAAAGVRELFAGAEPENSPSIRCLEGAGFAKRSDEPDAEGFLYFARPTHALARPLHATVMAPNLPMLHPITSTLRFAGCSQVDRRSQPS